MIFVLPYTAAEAGHKADDAAHPVDDHGDPHAHSTPAQLHAQQIAEAQTPHRHAQDGHQHGEFHVVGRAQGIGQHEGHRPQEDGAARVDAHQRFGQHHGLAGQRIDIDQLRQEDEDGTVEDAHGNVGPPCELAGIIDGLFAVACAHTAAHHRDHGKANGLAGDAAHTVEVVGHGVGRDLHGAKGGDHAHHQDASGLEQAVLKGRRNADAEDAFGHAGVQSGGFGHIQRLTLLVALAQNQHGRHHTGDDAGPCDAVHAHLQPEDAHRVAHDVDDVHQDADLHGNFRVAHAAVERRAAVIKRQERVAQSDDL